jgi:hypothetical protein
MVPDDQRRVVGPLQVIQDDDGWGGRAQLIRQRRQHLDAGDRRVPVSEQPQSSAAEQVAGVRPPPIRRARPHPEAVQHHPQRQPLGELVSEPPPDIPFRVTPCR